MSRGIRYPSAMLVGLGVIVAILAALFIVWATRFRYPPQDLPQVLCYHKVSKSFLFEGTWTTPARFAKQLDGLRRAGYEFIDEGEYIEALNSPSPEHANKLLLTFDDGYEELHAINRDVLKPRNIPCLVFLVSDYVGKDSTWDLGLGRPARHLDWQQIEDMVNSGATFGSHGRRHEDLTRADAQTLEDELAGSKQAIEAALSAKVRCFSYPFGRYKALAQEAVKKAGYDLAFSLYPRHRNSRIDRTALRRNGVYIIDTLATIKCKLRPNPFYWFEEMKCRSINAVAALTPWLKRSGERASRQDSSGRDS